MNSVGTDPRGRRARARRWGVLASIGAALLHTHVSAQPTAGFDPELASWGVERLRTSGVLEHGRICLGGGDSWLVPPNPARAYQSLIALMPGYEIGGARFGSLVARYDGAGGKTRANQRIFRGEGPQVMVNSVNEYRVFEQTHDGADALHFANVVRFMPIFYGASGFVTDSSGRMLEIIDRNDSLLFETRSDRLTDAGDTIGYRVVYLAPPDPASEQFDAGLAGLRSMDDAEIRRMSTEARASRYDGLDPETSSPAPPVAMQLNATWPDFVHSIDVADNPRIVIGDPAGSFPGSERYLAVHGVLRYANDGTGGLYLQNLQTDVSWDFESLADDAAPDPNGVLKRYTTEQMARLIDATTLDPEQPWLLVPYFATERLETEEMVDIYQRYIDRHNQIADRLGLDRPYFLLIGNPYHYPFPLAPPSDFAEARAWVEAQNAAALAVAQRNDRTAYVSLAVLTGGFMMLADAATEPGNQDAWQSFLASQGFDNWTNHPDGQPRDLSAKNAMWDGSLLHPIDADASDYMMELLLREMLTGSTSCPADLTGPGTPGEPDGAVDASDFFAYLDRFAAGDSAADLTGPSGKPDGVLDASDFFQYIELFTEPCP